MQFPTSRMKNRYILVRAGESTAEAAGYVLTNPVAKTSMDSGLSQLGKRQVKWSVINFEFLLTPPAPVDSIGARTVHCHNSLRPPPGNMLGCCDGGNQGSRQGATWRCATEQERPWNSL